MELKDFHRAVEDAYMADLDKIIYNIEILLLSHRRCEVPHFVITNLLYNLRFCPQFPLRTCFYRLVELGYNPFRLDRCQLERTMVINIVKVIDNMKGGVL